MEYRKVGKWGLELSELALGSWITFGSALDINTTKEIIRYAFDKGVNFFDSAEVYGAGIAEMMLGEALKQFSRHEIVVSTKIFWGGQAPNSVGLSFKHLVEGIRNSLKRLQMDYVDIVYCHRPDPNTPLEETVRAMDFIIRSGYAFYWGTSEWSKELIEEAIQIARAYNCFIPIVEQPQYNLFHRYRVEREYKDLYSDYGMGTTIWSPLDSGILTGKYNQGIPEGSRLEKHTWLKDHITQEKIEKVRSFEEIAKGVGCSCTQLAIAWCLKNKFVSSVLMGVSKKSQLEHNLKALEYKDAITEEVFEKIEAIFSSSGE